MADEIAENNVVARIEGELRNGEPAEGAHHAVEPLEVDDLAGGDDAADNDAANNVGANNAAADWRMDLTENELNLAIMIKEAIASAPEVDPVSDFMCAQLALIDGDDTEGAIERVHQLQCFREEYGILNTAEDGKQSFIDYVSLAPGLHLGFAYVPERGTYVMVYDMKKFRCSELCSDERLRAFLGGAYYTCVGLCPDFEAIRSGCIMINECDGYDWKRDFDFKSLRKVWSEVGMAYPLQFMEYKFYNAPSTFNIVTSMLKPFLPKYLRGRLEFGCQCEHRLDQLYMVPTVELAQLRLLTRFGETLDRRFENEQTFRL